MNETISTFICKELFDAGVRYVFFVPGAQVYPFLTTLVDSKLTGINAINELGAAYMADGYARASGNMGVSTTIGGPGANNMLTAAMIARVDEVGEPVFRMDYGLCFSYQCFVRDTLILLDLLV